MSTARSRRFGAAERSVSGRRVRPPPRGDFIAEPGADPFPFRMARGSRIQGRRWSSRSIRNVRPSRCCGRVATRRRSESPPMPNLRDYAQKIVSRRGPASSPLRPTYGVRTTLTRRTRMMCNGWPSGLRGAGVRNRVAGPPPHRDRSPARLRRSSSESGIEFPVVGKPTRAEAPPRDAAVWPQGRRGRSPGPPRGMPASRWSASRPSAIPGSASSGWTGTTVPLTTTGH